MAVINSAQLNYQIPILRMILLGDKFGEPAAVNLTPNNRTEVLSMIARLSNAGWIAKDTMSTAYQITDLGKVKIEQALRQRGAA